MRLPAAEDRGLVVFKLWPSIPYTPRVVVSFGLVAAGLALQAATGALLPGLVGIALGNSLLLVSGYDNRVDFARWRPTAVWERVEREKLAELARLHEKMRKWDQSALDVTNPIGVLTFVALLLPLGLLLLVGTAGMLRILAVDALVLLVPHWVTGVRRILTRPRLIVKTNTICALLAEVRAELEPHRVELLMLLDGAETRFPEDVKFKVDIRSRHPDFLGLYGQVVLNEVQGRSYPYFYVVLVACRGFGLEEIARAYVAPEDLMHEVKQEGDVEVLVIRQHTTRTSGYHTKPDRAAAILREGIAVAERVAVTAS
ncbi:MAG: hypothetical protein JXQ29_12180 [Planctomycetes bacterium]|nr:hypothetical protein [Planctomycetota bacterium]